MVGPRRQSGGGDGGEGNWPPTSPSTSGIDGNPPPATTRPAPLPAQSNGGSRSFFSSLSANCLPYSDYSALPGGDGISGGGGGYIPSSSSNISNIPQPRNSYTPPTRDQYNNTSNSVPPPQQASASSHHGGGNNNTSNTTNTFQPFHNSYQPPSSGSIYSGEPQQPQRQQAAAEGGGGSGRRGPLCQILERLAVSASPAGGPFMAPSPPCCPSRTSVPLGGQLTRRTRHGAVGERRSVSTSNNQQQQQNNGAPSQNGGGGRATSSYSSTVNPPGDSLLPENLIGSMFPATLPSALQNGATSTGVGGGDFQQIGYCTVSVPSFGSPQGYNNDMELVQNVGSGGAAYPSNEIDSSSNQYPGWSDNEDSTIIGASGRGAGGFQPMNNSLQQRSRSRISESENDSFDPMNQNEGGGQNQQQMMMMGGGSGEGGGPIYSPPGAAGVVDLSSQMNNLSIVYQQQQQQYNGLYPQSSGMGSAGSGGGGFMMHDNITQTQYGGGSGGIETYNPGQITPNNYYGNNGGAGTGATSQFNNRQLGYFNGSSSSSATRRLQFDGSSSSSSSGVSQGNNYGGAYGSGGASSTQAMAPVRACGVGPRTYNPENRGSYYCNHCKALLDQNTNSCQTCRNKFCSACFKVAGYHSCVANNRKKPPPSFDPSQRHTYCSEHPIYRNRYVSSNGRTSCCAVCTIPKIVEPFITSCTNLITHNISTGAYDDLIKALKKLIFDLPDLIYKHSTATPNLYQFHSGLKHKLFAPLEQSNAVMPEFTDEINHFIIHIMNKLIGNISNVNDESSLDKVYEHLNDCKILFNVYLGLLREENRLPISREVCPVKSFATGPLRSGTAYLGESCRLYLVWRSREDVPCTAMNRHSIIVIITCFESKRVFYPLIKSSDLVGVCELDFAPPDIGSYRVFVSVNGCLVNESPFSVEVKLHTRYHNVRNNPNQIIYPNIADPKSSRLWGLTMTSEGTILVGDRGPNVIVEYDSNFQVQGVYGKNLKMDRSTKGQEYFINGDRHMIICDKDHHRLIIIRWNGDYVRQTSKDALRAPWDFCVNQDNLIIVATHNSGAPLRVFNEMLENVMNLPLPAGVVPRGIKCGYLNHLIVTEFNKMELIFLYGPSSKYKVLESFDSPCKIFKIVQMKQFGNKSFNEGSSSSSSNGEKTSERLQCLFLDKNGNILVTDSRRKQIRVITYNGNFLNEMCTTESPMDVIVTNEGKLVYTLMVQMHVCCLED